MALPPRTPEQRAADLEKAAEVRKARAAVKRFLKNGTTTLSVVLADTSDAITGMRVTALIEAMPGVGKVRRVQIMERLQIDPKRRVRGLGSVQRQALEDEFAPA